MQLKKIMAIKKKEVIRTQKESLYTWQGGFIVVNLKFQKKIKLKQSLNGFMSDGIKLYPVQSSLTYFKTLQLCM